MIDFYGLTSPNVQKIFIMLEECGLPYTFKPVDVWASAQHSSEFAKLNPNKKIPVIVDHEGPGGKPYTVFESGAILMYLADKTGKFMPKDMAKKYDVIQWLMVQVTGVAFDGADTVGWPGRTTVIVSAPITSVSSADGWLPFFKRLRAIPRKRKFIFCTTVSIAAESASTSPTPPE